MHKNTRTIFITSGVLFSALVVWLGLINHTSTVQVSATTKQLGFRLSEDVVLFKNWKLREVQIENSTISFAPTTLSKNGKVNETFSTDSVLSISPLRPTSANLVSIQSSTSFIFNGLEVKKNSNLEVMVDSAKIFVRVVAAEGQSRPHSGFRVPDVFSLIAESSLVTGCKTNLSEEGIAFRSDEGYIDIKVEHGLNFYLQFMIDTAFIDKVDFQKEILSADNIRFDKRRTMQPDDPFLTSQLSQALVHIGAEDLFNKRFLMKEITVKEGEFLIPESGDVYQIQLGGIKNSQLLVDLYTPTATNLTSGKWFGLTGSVLPSALEYLIAEPGKKAIWSILTLAVPLVLSGINFFKSNESTHGKSNTFFRVIMRPGRYRRF